MPYRYLLLILSAVLLLSCKKQQPFSTIGSPVVPAKHILLKDITVPNLPSPYYHFEYNNESLVTKADFASGYTSYDILYDGKKIREMRNNIIVNHDTLRYTYDNAGKVTLI